MAKRETAPPPAAIGDLTPDGRAPGLDDQAPAAPGSLDSIANEADQMQLEGQGGAPGAEPIPPAPAGPTNAEVCAGVFKSIRETVCMLASLETPRAAFDDAKCDQLGEIWGGCADHYGINLSDRMGKFGPLIAAAFASIAIVAPGVSEVRREIAAKDSKPRQLQAPGAAETVTVGTAPARAETPGTIRPTFGQ
jgi:hypothetical protein